MPVWCAKSSCHFRHEAFCMNALFGRRVPSTMLGSSGPGGLALNIVKTLNGVADPLSRTTVILKTHMPLFGEFRRSS